MIDKLYTFKIRELEENNKNLYRHVKKICNGTTLSDYSTVF